MRENPNRTGLLRLKEEINIAERGKEILQDKIESLVVLFFEYVKERGERRKYVEDALMKVFRELVILESLIGTVSVKSDAFSVPEGSLKTGERKVMGIGLPEFLWERSKKGFQILNIPVKFDKTKLRFEEILEAVLKVGGIENSIQVLSKEIKETRKVVNSLENYVLPEFRSEKKWIELRLEELAREDLLRYKMIKRKLEISK
ncbi:MAG: V-type ATP synthase subunit D [Candidatus Aenigmarchaeota archaeon]|nr:V-type ATP synthase subunit D [Candidatus Aenigmarchaeota archaeon]NIP39966.1 V-type ATP synthase subunit D [Candidatus Aenigmarchaeota archaeon]NIQ17685.1 V-type ATP synthase subunit D [Candidatus Aenigmarchaeota archaeon]NIS72873.1 V-type ATP synthase subunit D [Candidatus Aenigmarchaeota archaeon]